tara:strand:+ start:443 stop:733 length:291 start_codon:yes stop_codon:yes gene_type:complete
MSAHTKTIKHYRLEGGTDTTIELVEFHKYRARTEYIETLRSAGVIRGKMSYRVIMKLGGDRVGYTYSTDNKARATCRFKDVVVGLLKTKALIDSLR